MRKTAVLLALAVSVSAHAQTKGSGDYASKRTSDLDGNTGTRAFGAAVAAKLEALEEQHA